VVSTNEESLNPTVRSIISTENKVNVGSTEVRFDLMPHKVFLFDRGSEQRIYYETGVQA
jgi:multiple sugar transport system ATP-binding protein